VRRKLTDTSHPDETLTDDYWLRYGDNPQPSMAEKIVYLTMEHVRAKGPSDFNSATICQRLGITNPMVNHYFGSRDGLLAATLFEVYRRYIGHLAEAVRKAPREPKARLEAWIREQIERTCEMGGWATMLNNPMSALHVSEVFQSDYREEVQQLFEENLLLLGYLVLGVRSGDVSSPPASLSPEQRYELLTNVELAGQVASVAWSTLGSAMWLAGQHLPSSRIGELWLLKDEHITAHVERVIRSVELNKV
jgi:AcrR family transcriptional regulator